MGNCMNASSTQESKPLRLIILGPPAAGKGTQAKKICDQFNCVHFSTGDAIRAEIKKGSELGKKIEEYSSSGKLVPDEFIVQILDEMMKTSKGGWLLDGIPRTKEQVDLLISKGYTPDRVIVLNVDEDSLTERVTGRRIDPETGDSYHIKTNPPPADIADRCIQRKDDSPETLQVRLQTFRKEVEAITSGFSSEIIVQVDGNTDSDGVFGQIKTALSKV